jgi:hypothetical protein
MGRMREVYLRIRSSNTDDPQNDIDRGMKQCPFCHDKINPKCPDCLGFGLVPRTYIDDEDDYINEMESRGDAQRQEI